MIFIPSAGITTALRICRGPWSSAASFTVALRPDRAGEANVTAAPKAGQRLGRGRFVPWAVVGSSGQEWRG
jgi:hypothetical protein